MNDSLRAPDSPASLVRIEAAALTQLASRLEGAQGVVFAAALDALERTVREGGKVVLTGVGKSGLIARKIAATLTSLSIPAPFLHAVEALHGDLGLLTRGDALVALSYSGETEEVVRLVPALGRLGVQLFSFTGCADSSLARASAHTLDVSVDQEACNHQLAPTASTTAMLALGDALAVTLAHRLGFAPYVFAELHPGGSLGRRLAPVRELMHTGEALPIVSPDTCMPDIIHEMSRKRLGMTTVQDTGGSLLGILSDGDLRRLFEHAGPEAFHRVAADVMNGRPRTVDPGMLALDALALVEEHKITALVVTRDGSAASPVVGVVHLHDLWKAVRPATSPGG